jgi:hypothetical protein
VTQDFSSFNHVISFIPPIEFESFSFNQQDSVKIKAGTLLPSVRYSMVMTLSHREAIENDPGCMECTTLRGITFEV